MKRIAPGDRWQLIKGDDFVHPSLIAALEAYYQLTGDACEYRLVPMKGMVYAIHLEEEEVEQAPQPKFSIYGDYEL